MTDGTSEPTSVPSGEPRAPRAPSTVVRTALVVYMTVNLAYGIPMLVWPDLLWDTIAGADGRYLEALLTTRWAGGVLVGLTFGAFLMFTRPTGQWTMMTAIAAQTAVASVGIWLSLLAGEWTPAVDLWFVWLAAIVVPAESLYLWYARVKARELLAV